MIKFIIKCSFFIHPLFQVIILQYLLQQIQLLHRNCVPGVFLWLWRTGGQGRPLRYAAFSFRAGASGGRLCHCGGSAPESAEQQRDSKRSRRSGWKPVSDLRAHQRPSREEDAGTSGKGGNHLRGNEGQRFPQAHLYK